MGRRRHPYRRCWDKHTRAQTSSSHVPPSDLPLRRLPSQGPDERREGAALCSPRQGSRSIHPRRRRTQGRGGCGGGGGKPGEQADGGGGGGGRRHGASVRGRPAARGREPWEEGPHVLVVWYGTIGEAARRLSVVWALGWGGLGSVD